MPRFKIETSLFEPVTIEVEGGRIYESAPLSPRLIKEVARLEEQRKAKTLDDMTAITQQVGLIFGIAAEEVETIDMRILNRILENVMEAMKPSEPGKPAEPVSPGAAGVTAEKNGPTPGGEVSQA